jgi:hypothetical protein
LTQVDDLLHTAQLFEKHDGKIYRGPISIPNLDQGICQIKDPFGNVIGLQGKLRVIFPQFNGHSFKSKTSMIGVCHEKR